MSEHARLSPSGSHRWLTCPGSIVLESAFPNVGNEFSDNGTAMHTVASNILGDSLWHGFAATEFIGKEIEVSE